VSGLVEVSWVLLVQIRRRRVFVVVETLEAV
jgi:hypothetical protein